MLLIIRKLRLNPARPECFSTLRSGSEAGAEKCIEWVRGCSHIFVCLLSLALMPAGYAAESEINNSLGVLSEQLKQLGEGVEKSGDLRLQHVFDNWADDTKVFSIIALVEGIDQTSDQVKLIAKSIKAVIQAFYAQLIALKDNRSLYQKFAGTVLLTAKRLEAAVEGLFKSSFADTPLSIKEDLASWKRDPLKLYENNNLLDTIVKIVDEYKAAVAVKEAL